MSSISDINLVSNSIANLISKLQSISNISRESKQDYLWDMKERSVRIFNRTLKRHSRSQNKKHNEGVK